MKLIFHYPGYRHLEMRMASAHDEQRMLDSIEREADLSIPRDRAFFDRYILWVNGIPRYSLGAPYNPDDSVIIVATNKTSPVESVETKADGVCTCAICNTREVVFQTTFSPTVDTHPKGYCATHFLRID